VSNVPKLAAIPAIVLTTLVLSAVVAFLAAIPAAVVALTPPPNFCTALANTDEVIPSIWILDPSYIPCARPLNGPVNVPVLVPSVKPSAPINVTILGAF